MRWAGPVLIVLLGVLLIVLFLDINSTQSKQDRQQAELSNQQVLIQRERYDVALRNCLDQNHRHDAAVAFLVRLAGQQKLSQEGLKEFETFINALAPRVADCAKRARLVVSRP